MNYFQKSHKKKTGSSEEDEEDDEMGIEEYIPLDDEGRPLSLSIYISLPLSLFVSLSIYLSIYLPPSLSLIQFRICI